MKRVLIAFSVSLLVILGTWTVADATSTFITGQGGTGTSSPSGILFGDNGATSHLNTVIIGSNLTFSGGTLSATGGGGGGSGNVATSTSETAGQLAYWTSTGATPATLGKVATTTVTCAGSTSCTSFVAIGPSPITITGGGISDPFTHVSVWGQTTSATSTLIALTGSPYALVASSTSVFQSASTTYFSITGLTGPSGLGISANGQVYAAGTTTFTGSAPISLTYANGQVTGSCSTCNTSNATVSSVATNNGLTGGTITTTGTLGLANILSGQVLANGTSGTTFPSGVATSSLYGVWPNGDVLGFSGGSLIGLATTTFNSPLTYAAGAVSCASCLTGNQTITLSGVVTGSGATSITTAFGTTAVANSVFVNNTSGTNIPTFIATSTFGSTLYGTGTNGQHLAWLAGAPTWTATTTTTAGTGIAVSPNGSATAVSLASMSAGVLGTPITGVPSSQSTSTLYGSWTNGMTLAFSGGNLVGVATTSAGTGLTNTEGAGTNTFSVNSSQSIATLSNLTNNGFVYTSGGGGTLNASTFSADTIPFITHAGTGIGYAASSSLLGVGTLGQVWGYTATGGAWVATSSSGGSSSFDWTPATNFGVNTNSTTTPIWLKASPISLMASSTLWADQINIGSTTAGLMSTSTDYGNLVVSGNASTTNLAVSTSVFLPGLATGANRFLTLTSTGLVSSIALQLSVANGGTNNTSAYTAGSVIFSDGSKLTQNNTNLFWNNTSTLLGIGTTTPQAALTIASSTGPQVLLTDGLSSNAAPWYLRAIAGNLFIGTSSPTTYATSTIPAVQIIGSGSSIIAVGTTTALTTSTTTLFMQKLQFQGSNSAGVQECGYLNNANTLVWSAGPCP